jgi:hypothetical protein
LESLSNQSGCHAVSNMVTKEFTGKFGHQIAIGETPDKLEYVKGKNTPFQFGPRKAQLVVDNFDAIKSFAEKHKKSSDETETE